MGTFFSDFFGLEKKVVEDFGAFDVSLLTDLPLFIDPFLLFNSRKPEYQELHQSIIQYLKFLRDKAIDTNVDDALLRYWYCFPEVKQNWFGFTENGNEGSGLGIGFARALHFSLQRIFSEFGSEKITRSSHLEKVCLVADKVGKDSISDFTTNLIKDHLYLYTQSFAEKYLSDQQVKDVAISNALFNFETESWESKNYILPWANGDHVVLTPTDLLTRDDNWINRPDLVRDFQSIPSAIPNEQLRAKIDNYFHKSLIFDKKKGPTEKEKKDAVLKTIEEFPELIDFYIKYKEDNGSKAKRESDAKQKLADLMFRMNVRSLQDKLAKTGYYSVIPNTYEEAHEKLRFFKDVIENKGGQKAFYGSEGLLVTKEEDLQIMFRLVWHGSPSAVTREANDGRGPADFKISRGSGDITIVEIKLAKNSQLKRNLQRQVEIYQKASDAKNGIKVIVFFTPEEEQRVKKILSELEWSDHPDVVLIDACRDNKPSGSKA